MYWIKTPQVVKCLFPQFTWNVPEADKTIYLTFDDGPIPDITPFVLETLADYEAKATFFCVGDNIGKHPAIFEQVYNQGHAIGNHTFNHLNGWYTENIPYFRNVRLGAAASRSSLFRPPYGKLKPSQAQALTRHYDVIMWDVLSGDFDLSLSPEQCLKNVLTHTESGSVIVFHDSQKAAPRLLHALPRVLDHFSNQGYRFEALSEVKVNKMVSV